MSIQQSSQRAQEHSPAEWEAIREVFTELYQSGTHALKKIITILKLQYGFEASERQYKGKIKKWSLERNIKFDEAKFMLYKRAIREHKDGKDTVFRLNGREVEKRKLIQAEKKIKCGAHSATIWTPGTLTSLNLKTPSNIKYETPVIRVGTVSSLDPAAEIPSAPISVWEATKQCNALSMNATSLPEEVVYCPYCIHITRGGPGQSLSMFHAHLMDDHADKRNDFAHISCNLCSREWHGPINRLFWMFEAHLQDAHSNYEIMLGCGGMVSQLGIWNPYEYDQFILHEHHSRRTLEIQSTQLSQTQHIYGCLRASTYVGVIATINPPPSNEQPSFFGMGELFALTDSMSVAETVLDTTSTLDSEGLFTHVVTTQSPLDNQPDMPLLAGASTRVPPRSSNSQYLKTPANGLNTNHSSFTGTPGTSNIAEFYPVTLVEPVITTLSGSTVHAGAVDLLPNWLWLDTIMEDLVSPAIDNSQHLNTLANGLNTNNASFTHMQGTSKIAEFHPVTPAEPAITALGRSTVHAGAVDLLSDWSWLDTIMEDLVPPAIDNSIPNQELFPGTEISFQDAYSNLPFDNLPFDEAIDSGDWLSQW